MLCATLSGWASNLLGGTEIGVRGSSFTINGEPTFLLGISCYGALGADETMMKEDLDQMQRHGFNWIRVWATWAAFGNQVSAVNRDGSAREAYLDRLRRLVADCDARGMIVDVTLSRENGVTGPPRLLTVGHHRRAVEVLLERLKPFRNWYLDLANERSIRDKRYVSHQTLAELRARVRELDPKRLVTASHSSSDDDFLEELDEYLKVARLDFLAPHRPRQAGSAAQTEPFLRHCFETMKRLETVAPIHLQEPFRRGFGDWEPTVADFLADLRGAIKGGAAGWCLHNGDQRKRADGRPRRSFDLRETRLFDQLDEVERTVAREAQKIVRAVQ